MQTVVIIGTDHPYQRVTDEGVEEIRQFRSAILDVVTSQAIEAIAEEMSKEALQRYGATYSVAELLCAELGIPHQFSDPTNSERYRLGIRQDSDIRAEHLTDGWTEEEIEADVQARGANASDRIREQHWWQRILELNRWPVLFICGANHVEPFVKLQKKNRVQALVAHSDWEPT